jgi:ABC-type transport system substrate-binding protein
MIPGLATSWEMSTPDGKTWTFRLRKGVPFHAGWGEFTARDVTHTIALNAQKQALGTDTFLFRQLFGETEEEIRQNIQTPDDYTVVFQLKRPRADMDFIATARQGNLLIYSKAQWDKDGAKGYEKPAGTGPWQFAEWQLGQWMLFQGVEGHWRKTPEFKEFQLFRVPEAVTRLAMVLAREANISEVDRELHQDAVAKGMRVVNSQLPSVAFSFIMGGLYNPSMPTYDPAVPALNVKVREAINRAVNRQELLENIFAGQGWSHVTWGYHPNLEGWNPEWEQQFETKYGYAPQRARDLLAEAGYPNGFEVTVVSTTLPGAPEMIPASEVMALYLRDIGVKVKMVEMEFAKLRDLYRASRTHNLIFPIRGTYRPLQTTLGFYNYSGPEGFQRIVPYKEMDEKYLQLVSSVDRAERERLIREIGDIKFNGYTEVPIVWLPGQIVVDPKVVGEYIFPGNINGVFSHLEYVKPAQ